MAVNIPHGFKVNIIVLYFRPVRLMVILKMRIPVYLCIKEVTVLNGISKHIHIIARLPFICLNALLTANKNSIS